MALPGFLVPLLKQLLVSIVVTAIGYALMPRPKGDKPKELEELEAPTAEAGRPKPVLFGEKRIYDVNFIWTGQKQTIRKQV